MKIHQFPIPLKFQAQVSVLLIMVSFLLFSCDNDKTAYLKGMPTAEQANQTLKTKIQAEDSLTYYAKRVAALHQLSNLIRNLMAYDRPTTPTEAKIAYSYIHLADSLKEAYSGSLESEIAKHTFEKSCKQWEEDGFLEDLVTESLLSPDTKLEIDKKYAEITKGIADAPKNRKLKGKVYLGAGICLVISWIMIGLYLGKRKLKRTNSHGVQQFDSYNSLVKSELSENVLSWIAYLLLFIGLGVIVYAITILTE